MASFMSICPHNKYYSNYRCYDCNSTSGTFDIQPTQCVHCANMVQNSDTFISALAYKICADPINTPFPVDNTKPINNTVPNNN